MAETSSGTITTANITIDLQAYFDARTLEVAEQNLPLAQFAVRRDLPPRSSKTIQFTRFEKLTVPSSAMTDGTVLATPAALTVTTITATIDQWGKNQTKAEAEAA